MPVDFRLFERHRIGDLAIESLTLPDTDFGRLKMERLAQWVEDLGGGLLVTSGERSFGVVDDG